MAGTVAPATVRAPRPLITVWLPGTEFSWQMSIVWVSSWRRRRRCSFWEGLTDRWWKSRSPFKLSQLKEIGALTRRALIRGRQLTCACRSLWRIGSKFLNFTNIPSHICLVHWEINQTFISLVTRKQNKIRSTFPSLPSKVGMGVEDLDRKGRKRRESLLFASFVSFK